MILKAGLEDDIFLMMFCVMLLTGVDPVPELLPMDSENDLLIFCQDYSSRERIEVFLTLQSTKDKGKKGLSVGDRGNLNVAKTMLSSLLTKNQPILFEEPSPINRHTV